MRANWARLHALIVAVLLALLVSGACGGDDPDTTVEEAAEEDKPAIVLGEPFEGTALVDEVLGDHGFRLLDTLVVTVEPVDMSEGILAVVEGTVREWAPDRIEDQLGVNFDEPVDELDDELVIVADRVERAPPP